MSDLLIISLLFVTGLITGYINVMAGGGSALTLPLMIFLGLEPALANGTNRIGILLQTIASVRSFKKHNIGNLNFGIKLSLISVPTSIIGAYYASSIDDVIFKWVLSGVLILVILSLIFSPKAKKDDKIPLRIDYRLTLAMLIIGFYGGFIQVGVGFMIMFALSRLLSLDLVTVNYYKVLMVFVFTIPAFIIFVITGNVDFFYGIILAIGNMIGAVISTNMQIKKGEKIVKYVLFASIIIIILKLTDLI